MKRKIAKALAGILLALSLAGCDIFRVKPDDPASLRTPPAEAMVLCGDLTPLEDPSMGAVVDKLVEASSQYRECASKHKQLKEFLERDGKPENK